MISIFLDTNVVFSREENFSKLPFAEKIIEIIDEIESNDLYESVQVLIPQIVLDELLTQQVEKYEEAFAKIKNMTFHNFEIKYDRLYESQIHDMFNEKMDYLKASLVKTEILPYPKNDVLEKVIQRAVLKKAPFEGRSKESDKGFKDVILWETILEYKREHATDTILLFTGDARICDSSLSDEYRDLFNDTIYLIKKEVNHQNKDLFDCIEDLTNKKIKPLFSQELESRLLNAIDKKSISDLFINEKTMRYLGFYSCLDIEIISKEITNTRDKIEDSRISFTVNVIISATLKRDGEKDYLHQPKIIQEEINSDLEIDYSFQEDTFYLREYITIDKGQFTFASKNIELTQSTEDE